MRRWIAGLVAVSLVGMVLMAAPGPAEARYRGYGHGHHHHHNGAGYFWGGLAAGAIGGLIVGSIVAAPPVVAAPPPVVYPPQPVYVSPAPVCTDYFLQGYWSAGVWVAPHWERVCR
jgi:hypothetical protein